ncbi:MAG: hypothetical protein ABR991_07275 [Terracidiphilus sp.]|jgi:hypothetical protein
MFDISRDREWKYAVHSLERFIDCPSFQNQPVKDQATDENPRFELRFVRAKDGTIDEPNEEDIQAVAHLSHVNDRIRLANPDLTLDGRIKLYTNWYRGNRKVFGLLERFPADRFGMSIIANTTILPLPMRTFESIRDGSAPVISLKPWQFSKRGFGCLLLDTWVVHKMHQRMPGLLGSPRNGHKGFADLLLLRHIADFWTPPQTKGKNRKRLIVFAEPDSASMKAALPKWGFENVGVTHINEPLYRLEYPPQGKSSQDRVVNDLLLKMITVLNQSKEMIEITG